MADYDIYREQFAIKYPSYGHALWDPSPGLSDWPVQVGDVGFIRKGKFHRLFNALLPADDPSHERGVPEYHEPLSPISSDHLDTDFLSQDYYCSAGVTSVPDPGHGPDDFPKVSFQYKRTRGAAVLSLPVRARREDTLAKDEFKWWMVKHIDSWLAFARKLRVGIDQMEEIILVTGCHRARSRANVAFLGNQVDAQVTFGVKVEGPDSSIKFQFSRGNARGAVLRLGPEGTNLPDNQCVFIRGFRVARSLGILQRRLKAAMGPSSDLGGYNCNPLADTKVISIPAVTKRDPLHLLLEYIAEQASDCDMVLTHDDDLVTIDGLGHKASLESLEPEVMMDLFQKSNIEIHKAFCDLRPTDSAPSADTSVVKVAMVSMKLQNLSSNGSQWSPLAGQNVDLGNTSKSDILLAPDKIRNSLSNIWPSLSKFAHVERDTPLTTVVVTCCAISLLGCVLLFNWDVESKLFLTLLLASFPLSVWFEREFRCRCLLNGMSSRLQHCVRFAAIPLNLIEVPKQMHVEREAARPTEDLKQVHSEPEATRPTEDLKQVHAELGAARPTEDLNQVHAKLGEAGVPVSFADCRNCPNPCEDEHEEYPRRVVSMIDVTSDMLGSVKPYRRQVVISTGKDDWEHTVTNERGSLASYISNIKEAEPLTTVSAPDLPVGGIFKDSENDAVGILNGSHKTLSYNDHETVLVFPDYKVLTEVPRSLDGARELWRNSVNPSVSRLGSSSESSSVGSWVLPYTCVILICSHGKRDVRCAVVAPILERAFTQTLQDEGWDVHTKLEDPAGSPLEDYHDEDAKEAEFSRRLQELDEDLPKKALILMTSHITGHKYAGNVIIYMPQGAGVWYGRVSTHEVASIVHTTILGGRILPPLLRGGVNLARPDCKRLNDW